MTNQNGQIVFKLLESQPEPLTMMQILSEVSKICAVQPKSIKDDVKIALENGVASGYIQMQRKKYTVLPLDMSGYFGSNGVDNDSPQTAPPPNADVVHRGRSVTRTATQTRPDDSPDIAPWTLGAYSVTNAPEDTDSDADGDAGAGAVAVAVADDVDVDVGGAVERAGRKRKASQSPKRGLTPKRSASKGRSESRKGNARSKSAGRR